MLDTVLLAATLVLSIPVFAYSLYTLVLLAGSFAYVQPDPGPGLVDELPFATVLLAVFNEGEVVRETLRAVGDLDYDQERLQLVVADDSTDETVSIVDEECGLLRAKGLDAVVSRRGDRAGFKAGALNRASQNVKGDYVLLVDADSRLSPRVLKDAVGVISGGETSFVSFRVGHYNRGQNSVTRSYALFQDSVDGIQKMGAQRTRAPFSMQGGFAVVKASALSDAGYWKEGVLAEDADLSCRLYSKGHSGVYLSGSEVFSEDPSSLRVWKRQVARVAHGWAQCLRRDFSGILRSESMGFARKLALLLTMLSPFAALSWIAVTLLAAYGIVFGVVSPQGSVYSNPAYVALVTLPAVVFYVAGVKALHFRKMLTPGNLLLLPYLSYLVSGTFAISGLSFAAGLAGRRGYFFRTPKGPTSGRDRQSGEGRGVVLFEAIVSLLALGATVPVLLAGQYFLGLALFAFGLVTLKSMELSRLLTAGGGGAPHA